jgi:hypothetical protein
VSNFMSHVVDGVYEGPSVWDTGEALYSSDPTLMSLGSLERVVGDVTLRNCTALSSLGSLRSVSGSLFISEGHPLKSLGFLESVGKDLHLSGCFSLKDLGVLTSVGTVSEDFHLSGGSLYLIGCPSLVSLGPVSPMYIHAEGCGSLEDLGRGLSIYQLYLEGCSSLTDLCRITSISEDCSILDCTSLTSLYPLSHLGSSLRLSGCTSLPYSESFSSSLSHFKGDGSGSFTDALQDYFTLVSSAPSNFPLLLGKSTFLDRLVRTALEAS